MGHINPSGTLYCIPDKLPLADTPTARSIVKSQSGRPTADLRQRQPPPILSLSLNLPQPEALPPETINGLTNAIAREEQYKYLPGAACGTRTSLLIVTNVRYGPHGVYTHPESGTFSRSYHVCYEVNDLTGRIPQVTKAQAKAVHKVVCDRIGDISLPGITPFQRLRFVTFFRH